ncbi:MAG: hypothetical protein Tsb0016_11580 [Sphingomonadales bacterium]
MHIVGKVAMAGREIFPRTPHREQTRSLSWSIRHLIHANLATPEETPDWLVPKSYYRWLSQGWVEWLKRMYVESDWDNDPVAQAAGMPTGHPEMQAFNKISGGMHRKWRNDKVQYKRWMDDYTAMALGLPAIREALPEWKPLQDWAFNGAIGCVKNLRGICGVFEITGPGEGEPVPPTWAGWRERWAHQLSEYTMSRFKKSDAEPWFQFFDDRWQSLAAVMSIADRLGYADAWQARRWLRSQEQIHWKAAGHRPGYREIYRYQIDWKPVPDVMQGLPLNEFLPAPSDGYSSLDYSRLPNAQSASNNMQEPHSAVRQTPAITNSPQDATEPPTLPDLTSKGRELLQNSGDWIRQP